MIENVVVVWLCMWLFAVWRMVKNSCKLIVACLLNGPVVTLVVFVLLALAGGACFACVAERRGLAEGVAWSLDNMFSADVVRTAVSGLDVKSLRSWLTVIVSMFLFLTTWLVGGGVLLGVIFDSGRHYLERIRDGRIRYRLGLIGHHIILGWDPNAVTIIRERCGGSCQRSVLVLIKQLFRPRPCFVVLTEKPAVQVGLAVNAAFGRDSLFVKRPFRVLVYNGIFDAESELKQLNISSAKDVTILGEHNESAHDSRVLLLLAHLNSRQAGRKRKIRCWARVASHSLYCLLTGDRGKYDYPQIDLSYFNFYENWAKRLWSAHPPARGVPYPHLRFGGASGPKVVHLVIVGFGQMGQALALEAAGIAHYGDGCKVIITAVDPNLTLLAKEFSLICPRMESMRELGIDFQIKEGGISCRVESDDFESYLKDLATKSGEEQQTIILTHSSPDDVIACAQAVWRIVGSAARILVRQDIASSNYDSLRHELSGCGTFGGLHVFGFQGGVGAFSSERERLSSLCFDERAKLTASVRDVGDNRAWGDLVDYVRVKFRQTFDALGEILCSVDVEVVAKPMADQSFSFHDQEIEVLTRAFHKHWRAGMLLAGKGDPEKDALDADEKGNNIDRDLVVSLPALLDGVGLGLRRDPNRRKECVS